MHDEHIHLASGDAVFLQKAQELGHVLKLAYGSESDLPARGCVPFLKMCETTFFSNIAEVGTQLIEWRALAYHTRCEGKRKKTKRPTNPDKNQKKETETGKTKY